MSNLIHKSTKWITAKYMPGDDEQLTSPLEIAKGNTFRFKNARPVNGVNRWWPDDITFPGSSPVRQTSLEDIKELIISET